ncbi:MAG: hypothetical protein V2J62_03850 [candidate division KSB1 bacterium]|jgi:hypothetical protein|nr:hypothetical protein [candidate division KSB1 bacterium]
MKRAHILTYFICHLIVSSNIAAQPVDFRGQASGWLSLNDAQPLQTNLGIRYIPSFYTGRALGDAINLDIQLSISGFNSTRYINADNYDSEWTLKPYRAWIRLSTNQFEARVGLQKINFGSATLFRPLMWFDQIDPRDPLQITDGVYSLLLRYYFLNNANIWLWGLYGNDDPKGWEVFPSDEESFEFGGRFQIPLLTGEIGASYHHRQANINSLIVAQMPPAMVGLMSGNDHIVDENRFAVDGKWDAVVGIWAEAAATRQKSDYLPYGWRRSITIGADYTFDLGNGLSLLGEYFTSTTSEKMLGGGDGTQFLALSANYPLNLLDVASVILYVDVENDALYRFISWQRTYDHINLYLFGFWNPDDFNVYNNADNANALAGKGFQIMLVYNH